MYSIDGSVTEKSVSKFIEVTPENCIQSSRFFQDFIIDTEKGYFDVIVEDLSELTARKRYFIPELGKGFIDTQEKLQKEELKLLKIVTNIARRFLGDEYKSPDATSLVDLISKVVNDIKTKCPDWQKKDLWIKVVLDKGNFPTLPNYSPICYEATMTKEEIQKEGLRITKFDKVEESVVQPTSDAPTSSASGSASTF